MGGKTAFTLAALLAGGLLLYWYGKKKQDLHALSPALANTNSPSNQTPTATDGATPTVIGSANQSTANNHFTGSGLLSMTTDQ